VIGKSERPLTSSEIEEGSKLSKYVFEMLEKLVPIGKRMRGERIFVLEEIFSKDIDKKFKSIKKLEKALGLNWNIIKEDIETESVKVEEINSEIEEQSFHRVIKLSYGKASKITMTIKNDIEDKQLALVGISYDNNKEVYKKLWIEKNQQKKFTVYIIKEIYSLVNYLDITYDNETLKMISLLEKNDRITGLSNTGNVIKGINHQEDLNKEIESVVNIENIKSDRSKWRYSLNVRGFLLYLNYVNHDNKIINLLNPKKYDNKIKKDSNPEFHSDIVRIKEVLSNPVIKNKFIFLNEWEKFKENGFNVIETLLQIANEFQEQLEKYDETI
jgi:hypothetical protein